MSATIHFALGHQATAALGFPPNLAPSPSSLRAPELVPGYARPEQLATGPNEVWTRDVTWLEGPAKYTYYRLHVILDLFNRITPG